MTYHSLRQFYAGRPDRAGSLESDYGVMWQWGVAQWPRWSVSYIRDTGELYAIRQTPPQPVDVLAVIPPDPGEVYYRTVEAVLDGYADPDRSGHQIGWLIDVLRTDPRATMHYPRRGLDRRTIIWACCESVVGFPCAHWRVS